MLVTNIIAEHENGVNRVSANAGGASLWFESFDIDLRPAPEAFASALLIPSLRNGCSLTIDKPVSGKWLSNVEQLVDIFHEWWGYQKLIPKALGCIKDQKSEVQRTALFFSGGVDSFYSLLRSNHKIELLVTVHGFDVHLQDVSRMAAVSTSVQSVAAEFGIKSAIVRTNFREHPETVSTPWEQTHGGALAAIGHLLTEYVDRILISSTNTNNIHQPWGSHWRIDHLWSSDQLEIVHFGAELQRIEKARAIASEPLVRKHLRVCWENLSPLANCSRCEKCVRTRIVLAECGELANYSGLKGEESLARDIDALPPYRNMGLDFIYLLENGRLNSDVRIAIHKLIKRTQRMNSYPRNLANRALRKVLSLASGRTH